MVYLHQWGSEGPAGPATVGARGAEGARQGRPGRSSRRNPLARDPNKLFAGNRKSSLRYWSAQQIHDLLAASDDNDGGSFVDSDEEDSYRNSMKKITQYGSEIFFTL